MYVVVNLNPSKRLINLSTQHPAYRAVKEGDKVVTVDRRDFEWLKATSCDFGDLVDVKWGDGDSVRWVCRNQQELFKQLSAWGAINDYEDASVRQT